MNQAIPTRTTRLCSGLALLLALSLTSAGPAAAQSAIPELTRPVSDFAGVIDAASAQQMETLIRSLQQASGDVAVVATVRTFKPYADIREYAVKMFENHGKGIGQRGKDNGLLIVLAVDDRQVWTEVGYDLEQFITDGFSGETAREYMIPSFRSGQYGQGLLSGLSRIVQRIAERRQVTLEGVRPVPRRSSGRSVGSGGSIIMALFVLFMVINAMRGGGRRRRGWNSGVGPFGGGFGGGMGGFGGGGFGGGGFGGGFGGFGGGRSGGGGGGGSW